MATKRWIPFLLVAAMISPFAGCGGSTTTVQNPPPPPASKVTIAFQPEPSGSLAVGFSENLTAVVSNDPSNYGVDWSLTCQGGAGTCGSLSSPHTASGNATTYTAPSTISADSMSVEIVALATADPYKNVIAPITISSFDNSLKAGTYVLQAQGVDSSFNPYQIAGAIVLDGKGNITSGEQTANYPSGSLSDANLTGSYFVGSDGRGMLTINTNDSSIGTNGVETFSFVLLSSSHALISQLDISPAQTGVSAAGTMDSQTSTAAPSGGFAFVVSGLQISKMFPLALGGILNIDSPNTISGKGSVSDEVLKFKVIPGIAVSGTLTPPDSLGAVSISLTGGFSPSNRPAKIQFKGYIVDDAHIKLIESDNASGTGFGATGGVAISQGAATGTFTDNTSFSGTYVFGISGVDLSNGNVAPATLTSAGLFTADGSGNLTRGFTDTFFLLNTVQSSSQTGAQISAAFGGTYSVDSSGTGRASLTFDNLIPNPKFGYQPVIFFYLTGNGNPPLVLESGDNHYPSLGAGIAYPQATAAAAFSGDYGFSFTQENGSETDGTAQMNANPSANLNPPTGVVSGFADTSNGAGQDNGFLGTFDSPTSNLPFTGTLFADPNAQNTNVFPLAPSPPMAVNYYFIDSGHGFWIETDLVNSAAPSGQVSLGYYAARTPVCSSCP